MAVLMLVTACATGGRLREDGPPEDTGAGEAVLASLPTNFAPVRVSDSELAAALTTLWLNIPLRISTSPLPLYTGHRLALASSSVKVESWHSELERSYGAFCERRGTPGDCLTLLEDGPRLQANDKRSIALALAVSPALEGVDAEVRAMLNPTRVLATLSFTLTAYMALLLAPEPVTKGVALAFSVLMWGYLGWEFFDLLRAYAQLDEEAPRASTFAQLREIGMRFGRVIGPNSVRILVMVATAAIGETATLVSKGSKLPGLGQATRAVEFNTGLRLMDTAMGAERAIVSVNEGIIRIVLPINAVSMTARGGGGDSSTQGEGTTPAEKPPPLPRYRAFKSFDAFKRALGPAGEDKAWHHIVEQRRPNVERFGPEAIHNTENIVAVDKVKHNAISAYYSSISRETGGLVVREWLLAKSYEEQRVFGLITLRRFGAIP